MRRRASWCWTATPPSLPSWASSWGASSTERWIDAPVRPGKRGGAFCASAVPAVHPYVMLNYTFRRRDVLTLAHELGHGVHFALAAQQGIFHQGTPLTLAETASVFGETIVFGRLLEEDSSPQSRLALLAENLEGAIATVFRQVAMNRFEDLAHTAPPRGGRAVGGASRRAVVRQPDGDAGRLRARSPRATARGGPTSRTSSAPPATSTPTPTVSFWRCRSTSATSSAAPTSCPSIWSCSPPAARAARGAGRDRRRRPGRPRLLGRRPGSR